MVISTIILIIIYSILNEGLVNTKFEVVKTLNNINFKGEVEITTFVSTKNGNVELIPYENSYNVRLNGRKGGKYEFKLKDEENEYYFEYYFDKEEKTVVLNKISR